MNVDALLRVLGDAGGSTWAVEMFYGATAMEAEKRGLISILPSGSGFIEVLTLTEKGKAAYERLL